MEVSDGNNVDASLLLSSCSIKNSNAITNKADSKIFRKYACRTSIVDNMDKCNMLLKLPLLSQC